MPMYGFVKVLAPPSDPAGRYHIRGANFDPIAAGKYSSRSGKNIPAALTKVALTLSQSDLELIGEINDAYQLGEWDDFATLMRKAQTILSDDEVAALAVFDKVPAFAG